MKKLKDKKVCKIGKRVFKCLVKLIILAAVLYGLVYVPYRQLELTKRAMLISEARDIASCEAVAYQQLQQAEELSKKENKEVSDDDKKAFLERANASCLVLAGRGYLLASVKTNNGENSENQ
jgi:hypothetical protein